MKYQDLNLRKIREDNGLDFAHFTYLRGMCSCCFSPLELPARYWHKGIKPASMDNVQYLLFKNADNGSGWVKKTDELKDYQCVSWEFPETKLVQICKDLQKQLGDEYDNELAEFLSTKLNDDFYECPDLTLQWLQQTAEEEV